MAAYCLWRAETRPEVEVRDRYKVAYAAEITELDAHDAG
jgi:hypothetical protein